MNTNLRTAVVGALAVGLWLLTAQASAVEAAQSDTGGDWLDQPLNNWNAPGMDIPEPSTASSGALNPSCGQTFRWPETPEDEALVDAGWSLQAPYRGGWGLTVVDAASGYDGMCRPRGYNSFVFLDGTFVGTISPVPMDSRTSGAGTTTVVQNGRVSARYLRYAPTDPLCCPSRPAIDITFEVQQQPEGAVLTPVSRYTEGAH